MKIESASPRDPRYVVRHSQQAAFIRRSWLGLMAAAMILLGSQRAQALDTYFIDKAGTFSSTGDWWVQGFTVGTTTTFVLRFASDYAADAAVFSTAQLSNFENNHSFTGYSVLDNKIGTSYVTLSPGTYYVGARGQTGGASTYRLELDTRVAPLSDTYNTYAYVDMPLSAAKYVGANGGKLWQGFTIASGYRYFLDGCNSGLDTYVIPATELSNFTAGRGFSYFTDYSGQQDTANPGFWELNLSPGSYYLAFSNSNSISKAVVYTMERWRTTPKPVYGNIVMGGSSSWAVSGTKVNISEGTVTNQNAGGISGSLQLRLWATRSPYSGGSISGYVFGTRALGQLKGGYYLSSISGYVGYVRPPSGTYYTTMTLEEYTTSGWVIRDHVTFSSTSRF